MVHNMWLNVQNYRYMSHFAEIFQFLFPENHTIFSILDLKKNLDRLHSPASEKLYQSQLFTIQKCRGSRNLK